MGWQRLQAGGGTLGSFYISEMSYRNLKGPGAPGGGVVVV